MKKKIIRLILGSILIASLSGGPLFADAEPKEFVKTWPLADGAQIAIHYQEEELTSQKDIDSYTDVILSLASEAYMEVVYEWGFDAPGFTFVEPDTNYCYDPDKTIDIYISSGGNTKGGIRGFTGEDFLDAPCYDILDRGENEYDAVILFPADYKSYIESSRGDRVTDKKMLEEMKGTLTHEMLHVILYSYNKNVEPWYFYDKDCMYETGRDWYAEGLARYFEALTESYDDFFSEGFIKKKGDKLLISQEGVNFLMATPNWPFYRSRYDFALFWAYVHHHYGMEKIEELSRAFRDITDDKAPLEAPAIIADVLGKEFGEIYQDFALAIYLKSFDEKIEEGLNDVALRKIKLKEGASMHTVEPLANDFVRVYSPKRTDRAIEIELMEGCAQTKLTIIIEEGKEKNRTIYTTALDEYSNRYILDLDKLGAGRNARVILVVTNPNDSQRVTYQISSL
ncbi:MAG: hypothetical protein HQ593_04110 [Candidatus Omnitrophica bacterium]|nr:hypothetical protein [Candidatus Omnitrophota bacterium]